ADFATDQDVRWCPGCGDYAILAAVQKMMSKLPVRKEDHVFVSGIGCSSRFPYYMNTYGFHTIHGRAPAFASGLKATNPNLHVWLVTGDGDSLSIGGNHLIHLLRRNFNLTVLLFNNRIYGLTKGQYSPTSEVGKRTKSSPMGSLDHPFNPLSLALGADASFVARTFDVDAKHLTQTLQAAWEHKGTGFIEILQNCNIFNDATFADVTDKANRPTAQLRLEAGEPMLFDGGTKGIVFKDGRPEVVTVGDGGVNVSDVAIHTPDDHDPSRAFTLGRFVRPDFPVPMGVLRRVERPTYDDEMTAQVDEARASRPADLHAMLHSGYTWTVDEE
ncbi:MAG: 2-oxoglutarate ferredoxin oxidoreductase subunit beta, partial [Myxococcota bacterium]